MKITRKSLIKSLSLKNIYLTAKVSEKIKSVPLNI